MRIWYEVCVFALMGGGWEVGIVGVCCLVLWYLRSLITTVWQCFYFGECVVSMKCVLFHWLTCTYAFVCWSVQINC